MVVVVYAFNLDCRFLFVCKQNLVTKCLDNEEFWINPLYFNYHWPIQPFLNPTLFYILYALYSSAMHKDFLYFHIYNILYQSCFIIIIFFFNNSYVYLDYTAVYIIIDKCNILGFCYTACKKFQCRRVVLKFSAIKVTLLFPWTFGIFSTFLFLSPILSGLWWLRI